ncbi:hypothetical protein D7003_16285, partial [Arthrobacter oryzae]
MDSKGTPVAGATVSTGGTMLLEAPSWRDSGISLNGGVNLVSGYWNPSATTDAAGEAHLQTPRFTDGLPELTVKYTEPTTGVTVGIRTANGADTTKPITATLASLTQQIPVTPGAVAFVDEDGTENDTYSVPLTEGVDYLLNDKVVVAGTYSGIGTVTVTAKARTDYVLAVGAPAVWATTFKATPYPTLTSPVPA